MQKTASLSVIPPCEHLGRECLKIEHQNHAVEEEDEEKKMSSATVDVVLVPSHSFRHVVNYTISISGVLHNRTSSCVWSKQRKCKSAIRMGPDFDRGNKL